MQALALQHATLHVAHDPLELLVLRLIMKDAQSFRQRDAGHVERSELLRKENQLRRAQALLEKTTPIPARLRLCFTLKLRDNEPLLEQFAASILFGIRRQRSVETASSGIDGFVTVVKRHISVPVTPS